jgi:hypothetical protein
MTGYRITDPFGQVRSRVCQLAVTVSVTVMQLLTEVTKDVLQSSSSRTDDEVKSELKKQGQRDVRVGVAFIEESCLLVRHFYLPEKKASMRVHLMRPETSLLPRTYPTEIYECTNVRIYEPTPHH